MTTRPNPPLWQTIIEGAAVGSAIGGAAFVTWLTLDVAAAYTTPQHLLAYTILIPAAATIVYHVRRTHR